MDKIVTLQAALAITSPITATVAKAYPYFPPPQVDIPNRSYQNEWSMMPIRPEQAVRSLQYQVRMQFLAGPALEDAVRTAQIATAFWEQLVETFSTNIRAEGLWWRAILRGSEPTLGLIERAGKAYIGTEGFVVLDILEPFDWDL
jgi:hypothetical protein